MTACRTTRPARRGRGPWSRVVTWSPPSSANAATAGCGDIYGCASTDSAPSPMESPGHAWSFESVNRAVVKDIFPLQNRWPAHFSNGSLALGRIPSQKSRGVVVQKVAFLLGRQVVGVLNDADRIGHQLGPDQLVCSEHHAVLESGIYESLDVAIDFFDRIAPDESRNVDVDVGVSFEQREHVVDHGIPGMHHLNTQFRVARQEFL